MDVEGSEALSALQNPHHQAISAGLQAEDVASNLSADNLTVDAGLSIQCRRSQRSFIIHGCTTGIAIVTRHLGICPAGVFLCQMRWLQGIV